LLPKYTDTMSSPTETETDTCHLVIGASGQLGTELVKSLCQRYGSQAVIAADLRPKPMPCRAMELDVLDRSALHAVITENRVTHLYLMAALLSATGEKNPQLAWKINMDGLLNGLEEAVACGVLQVFWPSSIAVFGPDAQRQDTPQGSALNPTSMYGITKVAGEQLCAYYHMRYGLDVRSLRFPGVISWQAEPGGGTTDYAVHIFHEALKHGAYTCFLRPDTALPMIYIDDAIRAVLDLMAAPAERIRVRTSYNLAGLSFTPAELADAIRQRLPWFVLSAEPDFRQAIADSWPDSIDDTSASADWQWQPTFGLNAIVSEMLDRLAERQASEQPLAIGA
jgi:nucleoside-diphosphate-sugar epimerase